MGRKHKLEGQAHGQSKQSSGNQPASKKQKVNKVEKHKGKSRDSRKQSAPNRSQSSNASQPAFFFDSNPQTLPNQPSQTNRMIPTGPSQHTGYLQNTSHGFPNHDDRLFFKTLANNTPVQPSTINGHSRPQGLPQLPPILDPTISHLPFTHPSSISNSLANQSDSYEQLEFVGDAYIEVMATRLIYQRYKHLPVGRMSQIRELLVKNETLAEYSLAYKFDERADMPTVHDRKQRNKVLGDMFEAYVAAVILSDPINGFTTVEAWLAALWRPKLEERAWEDQPLDVSAKQELARRVLGKGIKVDYACNESDMTQHGEGKVWFTVTASLTGWGWTNQVLGEGKGLSKVDAGMRAAMQALENPLTAQISAVKKEHDDRIAAKRLAENSSEELSVEARENGETR